MREAAALRSLVMLGVLLGVSLVSADVQAEPIGSGGSRAPLELTTRGMLLQRWDRNRDGKIDLGEAEMARVQMRRERMEREEKSRVDPLTGRRSDDLFSTDDEDGGDFFRRRSPQNPGPTAAPTAPGLATSPQPSRGNGVADSDPAAASPTQTLLGPPTGLPPAAGGRAAPNAPLSSAARVLPQQTGRSTSAGFNSAAPIGGSRPFERPTAPLGTAVTGGIRAGAPAVRPGYGTSGTTSDLNAGRLLGGAPLTGGRPLPGSSQPGATTPRGSTPRGGTSPRPGSSPPEFYGP